MKQKSTLIPPLIKRDFSLLRRNLRHIVVSDLNNQGIAHASQTPLPPATASNRSAGRSAIRNAGTVALATAFTQAPAVRQHGGGRACRPLLTQQPSGRPTRSTGGEIKSLCCAAAGIIAFAFRPCGAHAYPLTGVRRAAHPAAPLRSSPRPHAQPVKGYIACRRLTRRLHSKTSESFANSIRTLIEDDQASQRVYFFGLDQQPCLQNALLKTAPNNEKRLNHFRSWQLRQTDPLYCREIIFRPHKQLSLRRGGASSHNLKTLKQVTSHHRGTLSKLSNHYLHNTLFTAPDFRLFTRLVGGDKDRSEDSPQTPYRAEPTRAVFFKHSVMNKDTDQQKDRGDPDNPRPEHPKARLYHYSHSALKPRDVLTRTKPRHTFQLVANHVRPSLPARGLIVQGGAA